jgi:hypothetical protein
MGQLYELSQRLMHEVEDKFPNPVDQIRAKGALAQSAGFMVSLVGVGDADDPAKIAQLRKAGVELGITV